MYIECRGHQFACIYDLFLCCLYIDVKENIICQNLKVLFIIYEELTVSETKGIVSNLTR